MGTEYGVDNRRAWGASARRNPDPLTPPAEAGTHNAAWVVADPLPDGSATMTLDKLKRIIAHEIGHVVVGSGHPDYNAGPAPLPGTDHRKRLMASGDFANRQNLLVKKEWDAAEMWMTEEVDK